MKTNLVARPLNNLSDFSLMRDELFFPMQETFDRFFQDFLGTDKLFNSVHGKGGYPKMEVGQEGDKWVVRVAVPGVKEEDLVVQIDDSKLANAANASTHYELRDCVRILRIQGAMSSEYQSPEGAKYFVRELRKSQFVREVALPAGLKGEPEAILSEGILTLKWQAPSIEDAQGSSAIKRIAIQNR